MTPPKLTTYVLGNPVALISSIGGLLYLGYQAWAGHTSWPVPVVAFFCVGYVGRCFEQVENYRRWKREWEALGGGGTKSVARRRMPAAKVLFGISCWVVCVCIALSVANKPGMQIPFGMFVLATLVMIGGAIYWLLSKLRKPHLQATKDIAVTVCLPMTRISPDVPGALSAVPHYCHPLLTRP